MRAHVLAGPPNPDNVPLDGKLMSETMMKDNRRYYLDLKENQRGRFLRVGALRYRLFYSLMAYCVVVTCASSVV